MYNIVLAYIVYNKSTYLTLIGNLDDFDLTNTRFLTRRPSSSFGRLDMLDKTVVDVEIVFKCRIDEIDGWRITSSLDSRQPRCTSIM